MKRIALYGALASACILIGSAACAADQVNDMSFTEQGQTVNQEVQIHQATGQFGRVGSQAMSKEGVPGLMGASADEDMDRYVYELGVEMRIRNAKYSRDPTGFR
ncbi:hypothetical protein [Pseudogulbenkiania subflava]|uniref:Uncharacterized protein n=1 Tax=Pseudogulbenkiania subflava DSM 22618 TaxID=1123014 RepID=A0A1Y6BIM8_9NEIS|nr:hypothetical protein [Pseudogulbenkiania subflava]SMF11485.1 hypothetical protein SAMN02745746_01411 [Pseudogulbenkiania subflava DSM 22618]